MTKATGKKSPAEIIISVSKKAIAHAKKITAPHKAHKKPNGNPKRCMKMSDSTRIVYKRKSVCIYIPPIPIFERRRKPTKPPK